MTALNILQITDLHVLPNLGDTMLGIDTEYLFRETLKYAHSQHGPFDLILLTGDLAQDPTPNSYQRICDTLLTYQTPCMCLPGNHDDLDLMKRYLNRGEVSCCKQLSMNGWQIIGLNSQKPDSPAGKLAEADWLFLEEILRTQPAMPSLIAIHHPCMPTHSAWLDAMQLENSAGFLALLKHFPQVKVVTCGHVHQELSIMSDDIMILATPASCFQFTPQSREFSIDDASPGYRTFTLFDDGRFESRCHRLPIKLDALDRTALEY